MQAPTLNEPAHLAAGVVYWQTGRFELFAVNPPLPRLVAALPAIGFGVEETPKFDDDGAVSPCFRPEAQIGAHFFRANAPRAFALLVAGRVVSAVFFSILGGVCCWRWACELFGPAAGLFALLLWCFTPDMMAHAQLATADLPAAACGVCAGYALWRWQRILTWSAALAAGVATGVAMLTKLTWIALLPLCPILALVSLAPAHRPSSCIGRAIGQLTLMMLTSIVTLNAGYGCEGTFTRLGDFRFCCETLAGQGLAKNRFHDSFLAEARLPVPAAFVRGIDLQQADFEAGRPAYLRGEWKRRGWYYYYLYAMLVKLPAGHVALLLWAVVSQLKPGFRVPGATAACIWGPALVVVALVSLKPGVNQHMRYVLPAYPYFFVAISKLAASGKKPPTRPRRSMFAWALLATSITSSLMAFPHSLSYFNELAGGPLCGHRHLLHSNLDWGQDLLFLRAWQRKHSEAQRLYLAYSGSVDPSLLKVDFTSPPPPEATPIPAGDAHSATHTLVPGWYAVSVNLLYEKDGVIPDGKGGVAYFEAGLAELLRDREPTAMAGYSIRIYEVTRQGRGSEESDAVSSFMLTNSGARAGTLANCSLP